MGIVTPFPTKVRVRDTLADLLGSIEPEDFVLTISRGNTAWAVRLELQGPPGAAITAQSKYGPLVGAGKSFAEAWAHLRPEGWTDPS